MHALLAQTQAAEVVGSTVEFWVFSVTAVLALGTGLSVVVLRNAVHAALMLVVNLFAIAVLYALLEAQFVAVVQIIVYAGAIMVLFLFVLMLLGISSETRFSDRVRGQGTASVLLGIALVVVLVGAGAGQFLGPEAVCPADGSTGPVCAGLAGANSDGNVAGVGRLLFTTYMWPFEVTSALLVIAALGAMVLGKRQANEDVTDRPAVDEQVEPEAAEPPAELVTAGEEEES